MNMHHATHAPKMSSANTLLRTHLLSLNPAAMIFKPAPCEVTMSCGDVIFLPSDLPQTDNAIIGDAGDRCASQCFECDKLDFDQCIAELDFAIGFVRSSCVDFNYLVSTTKDNEFKDELGEITLDVRKLIMRTEEKFKRERETWGRKWPGRTVQGEEEGEGDGPEH